MASLLGTTANCKEFEEGDNLSYSSSVQGVVDIYGLVDLTPEACITNGDVPSWSMDAFLGTKFTKESGTRASAIAYIDENTPPFFVLHGTKDQLVPISQSDKIYEVLQNRGVDVIYLQVEGAGHGDPMFYQDAICERIIKFLADCKMKLNV